MFVWSTFLISCFFGNLGAQSYIDNNRLVPRQLGNQVYSVFNKNGDDYDHHSSRHFQSVSPSSQLPNEVTTIDGANSQTPFKVYQPRENPRLFYQSDAYYKKNNGQNINNEVSQVYPGREVMRSSDANQHYRSSPYQQKLCLQCPHDQTLVLKPGSSGAKMPYPRLLTCSGRRAPRGVRFANLYGPKFGSLVVKGSHLVVGEILYGRKSIKYCKMQIHVVAQSCRVPQYLLASCSDKSHTCDFQCRDQRLQLQGPSTLTCGENLQWDGYLPSCRAPPPPPSRRTRCESPTPPPYGRYYCRGPLPSGDLSEGTKCWLQCTYGTARWRAQGSTVCRRGAWTRALFCFAVNRRRQPVGVNVL